MLNFSDHLPQYWTETTYPDESDYDITTAPDTDFEWRNIYRMFFEFERS